MHEMAHLVIIHPLLSGLFVSIPGPLIRAVQQSTGLRVHMLAVSGLCLPLTAVGCF